jgi:hypothetical protein
MLLLLLLLASSHQGDYGLEAGRGKTFLPINFIIPDTEPYHRASGLT